MNAGILAPGYAPPQMPRPLLGQPQPVPMPYGRAGDPFWGNVSLYLRMDGPHGSRTFADLSANANSVTANGDVFVTGQNGAFGQSATFDGSGDFLETLGTPSSLDLTADFTIEFFVNYTSTKSFMPLYCRRVNSGGTTAMLVVHLNEPLAGNMRVYLSGANGGNYFSHTGANLRDGRWHHVALTRSADLFALFVDGVRSSTLTFATGAVNYSNAVTQIGRDRFYTARDFVGLLDEYRITKGVARYTSNFTPPTAPFPIGYQ